MALHEVLFRRDVAWLVGEGAEELEHLVDRNGRRTIPVPVGPDDHYPDDYAGKVIAVCPVGHNWTKMDLAGGRSVVTLDLTNQERGWVAGRTRKIVDGKRVPVTFEDRWGAATGPLRSAFDDAEAAEAASHDQFDVEGRRFAEVSAFMKSELTPTVVHTGAGLYEVAPSGKPYTVNQAAFDQLWVDQGSTKFTSSQYVRTFAGTYDENVTPNAAFLPDYDSGFWLIWEGDSTDDRDNIVLSPSGGVNALYFNCDQLMLRHMKVMTTGCSGALVDCHSGVAGYADFLDCYFTGGSQTQLDLSYARRQRVEDCLLDDAAAGKQQYSPASGWMALVRNCRFLGNVGGNANANIGYGYSIEAVVEGCTFANASHAMTAPGYGYINLHAISAKRIVNNTFYNLTYGIALPAGVPATIINNIFKDVTTPFVAMWTAEETATHVGPRVTLRNNCYHGETAANFCQLYDGSYVSKADFRADSGVDAAGEIDADPLLTDPAYGTDDFSLAAASPCIRRAPKAGVQYDVFGNPYADDRVDIGAVSSGTSSVAPSITAITKSAGAITATVTVGGAPHTRARLANRSGVPQQELQRLGTGDIAFSSVVGGDYTIVAWGCDAAGNPIGEPSAIAVVTVPATSISSSGSTLRRTPHTVRFIRPTEVRNPDTGSLTFDYASPVSDRSVKGFVSTQGGTISSTDEGGLIPFDATFFTHDVELAVNDQAILSLPWLSGKFLVVGTEPKAGVRGGFDHNEVLLRKDNTR